FHYFCDIEFGSFIMLFDGLIHELLREDLDVHLLYIFYSSHIPFFLISCFVYFPSFYQYHHSPQIVLDHFHSHLMMIFLDDTYFLNLFYFVQISFFVSNQDEYGFISWISVNTRTHVYLISVNTRTHHHKTVFKLGHNLHRSSVHNLHIIKHKFVIYNIHNFYTN
ncbi:hypothetical protein ACJX0J_026421, partial [Zea mays]